MKDCVLFTKLSDKRVTCSSCTHRCTISDGHFGICGVRKNYHGTLKLLVWDKPTGVAVDPIEKKPLFHFLPGSRIFSFGTFGCNFGCLFCQNAMTAQITKSDSWNISSTKLLNQLENWPAKKVVDYCTHNKIPSIAFTYNEPSIFAEYAVDVMKCAKKKGIYGIFVTNGFQTNECLEYIEPYIDAYNIDLKSFRNAYYQRVCFGSLQPVLDTIKKVHAMKKWMEITTLIVDGKNDSEEELSDIANFIASISVDIPWHISACHPDYKMTDIRITPKHTLDFAYRIGKQAGLRYIYTGNTADPIHVQTRCHSCSTVLITRHGFDIMTNTVKNGMCPICNTHIPGLWH